MTHIGSDKTRDKSDRFTLCPRRAVGAGGGAAALVAGAAARENEHNKPQVLPFLEALCRARHLTGFIRRRCVFNTPKVYRLGNLYPNLFTRIVTQSLIFSLHNGAQNALRDENVGHWYILIRAKHEQNVEELSWFLLFPQL